LGTVWRGGRWAEKFLENQGEKRTKKNRGIREKITGEEKKGQKLGTVWRGGRWAEKFLENQGEKRTKKIEG
jgi:nitroreductase